jgi:hypothetical protein
MTPRDFRKHRLMLGFSVSLLAEILQIDSIIIEQWEAGIRPIDDPGFLQHAFEALQRARVAVPAEKPSRTA